MIKLITYDIYNLITKGGIHMLWCGFVVSTIVAVKSRLSGKYLLKHYIYGAAICVLKMHVSAYP